MDPNRWNGPPMGMPPYAPPGGAPYPGPPHMAPYGMMPYPHPMGMPPGPMYGGPPPPGMMYGMPPMYPMPPQGRPPAAAAPPAAPAPIGATLWVGKIAPGINDDVMRRLLLTSCQSAPVDGASPNVTWRRQLDQRRGSAPLQFGFADFKLLDDAARALRLLNGLKLGDRELQLKADEKTQKILDEHNAKKRGTPAPAAEEEYCPDEGTSTAAESSAPQPPVDTAEVEKALEEERKADQATLDAVRPIQEEINVMYVEMMNQDIDSVTDTEMVKAIRAFRAQKAKEEEEARRQQEERQRELQIKQQRIKEEKEKQRRQQEREDKEFLHRLRDWEDHEKAREIEFNRRDRLESTRIPERIRAMELDDLDEKSHRRRIRDRERRRERLKEFELDERERRAEEAAEAEKRRLEQEAIQREERERRLQEQLRREQEQPAQASPTPIAAAPVKVSLASVPKPKPAAAAPAAGSAFVDFEDDQQADQAARRKRPFMHFAVDGDEDRRSADAEVPAQPEPAAKRRKSDAPAAADSQSLIDRIPTDKQELFNYKIDWDVIKAQNIIDHKMQPWVAKKIVEYLGEEEPTLVDFVCSKLAERAKPVELISQLQVVLEEESEVFVLKLWRMLLFEMIRASSSR